MFKQLVARSVITGALVVGGASAVGAGSAHAQWNNSPQAQPIECSSWLTAYNGGMCRVEHFNQAATGTGRAVTSVAVPAGSPMMGPGGTGRGLTGINTGANTNASPI